MGGGSRTEDQAINLADDGAPPTLTGHNRISVAVDPVALVITECIAVTSAMRKHARWAHSSVAAILGGSSTKPPPYVEGRRATDTENATLKEDESSGGRWGLRGKKGKSMQDNPLISAFTRLRSDLKQCKGNGYYKQRDYVLELIDKLDIKTFDTPALLHPFLQVIRSSSTSGSITSLALIAITKFLSYNIISRDSPRLPQAMQLLSAALTHCRFEASNTAADEIVFLRILRLMEGIISGPGGEILSDESMCQIMETGLRLCCEAKLTQMLQRSAEISMVSMCQVVFERLKHLEVEAGDEPGALDEETKDDMDTVKMETSVSGNGDGSSTVLNGNDSSLSVDKSGEDTLEKPTEDINSSSVDLSASTEAEEPEIKPYSLPSIKELFRTLVELLDPHDGHYTDTMRVMALRIVDVALEVAGPSIANHPSLAALAKDTLCRHLFQLVRSENMAILNESLRVAGTLLATCRGVLKLQQELYLSYLVACLFPKVEIPPEPGIDPKLYEGVPQAPGVVKPTPSQPSSGRSTPVPVKDRQKLGLEGGARKPDAREAMVESIGALVRVPSFMADLFVNYDCDIDRSDLCTDMVGLLSRNAFPDSATWSTTNVPPLCLDALLGYVQSLADRLDDPPATEGFPTLEHLRSQRALKKIIIRGAAKFNEKPTAGVAFLASQGVIKNPDDAKEIARFVRATSRLDKKVLGDFLSKMGNEQILSAFMETFDFSEQRVDEALRQLLYTFRLPGESPLIARIVTEFSEKYCAAGHPEEVAGKDAVFILTYAIIMLNTDLHNPNLKSSKRMTLEDFSRNLRGQNKEGEDAPAKDFDPDYLKTVYDNIKTREIVLPEEHNNRDAYDHAWKELLIKVQSSSDLTLCRTNVFDGDMFAATWRPIVATMTYVFVSATDDAVFSRVIAGFDQCAQIAAKYGLSEALDQIIFCLSSITTLATNIPPNTSLNTEVQANGKSVMVSETAVRFGRDDRAQLATIVLFRVLDENEATVRDGWDHVIRILLNLFVNSLIPSSFEPISKTLDIPSIPLQPPAQIIDRAEKQSEGGLFSTLSSYVSSFANDEPPEPSELEIENTLCAVDCIKACAVDETFARISQLPIESLRSILDSLLAQIPEDSSPTVIVVKPELPPPSPVRPNGRSRFNAPIYDPTLVFVLELATLLALRDSQTVRELGKDVADSLQSVVRNASNIHHVVISRVVYYLLRLLQASQDHDFLRAHVVLHALSSFEPDLLQRCAGPLLKGIATCIEGPPGLRSAVSNSPDFWTILQALHVLPTAAPQVFHILEDLALSPHAGITANNYEQFMSLANAFATEGSVGAAEEQKRDRESRKGKQGKAAKPKHLEEVERGKKAMALVYDMTLRVPAFIQQSHFEATDAWNAFWSPIFRVLTNQCLNPCREIRHQAFNSLQRSLLSKDLASPDHTEWTKIFDEVLFPLIQRLLKPEVWQRDPVGMSETRVQAATLLCKVFLSYLVLLSEWDGMLELWCRILGICDRLMNSGQGDNLVSVHNNYIFRLILLTMHQEEAIPESLKNILLVMSDSGYLVPPEKNPEKVELWNETWKRLDRFLPNLFGELFPEEAKKPRSSLSSRPKQSAEASQPSRPPKEQETADAVIQEA